MDDVALHGAPVGLTPPTAPSLPSSPLLSPLPGSIPAGGGVAGQDEHRSWLRSTWPLHRRQVLQVLGAYVVLTALFTGIGLLITGPLENGSVVRLDERVARWFADRRTDPMNTLSLIGSNLAETWTKVLVTLIVAIVMMRMWRRWYEAAVISVALILEASVFVTVTTLVGRDRPDVPRLDSSPIGSSFPSGHVAAAMAYSAIAVVVFWHTRNRLARLLMAAACVLIPIAVGLARMYRGMHFLSDVTAGALLGGACVIVTVWIMQRSPEASVVKSGQEVEDGRVDGLGVGEVGRVSARHGDDTAAAH